MATPKTPTLPTSSKKTRLQDKIYNRLSFSTALLMEELSQNYFALNEYQNNAMPFLQEMKNKHRKCPYWKLLKHYCPCKVDIAIQRKKKKVFPKSRHSDLLHDHCTVGSVHSFLCSVLKRLIPLELFGNTTNRQIFFNNIKGLLLVQKYGEVSPDYLMREIKISKMSWLSQCSRAEQREQLLECIDFFVTKVICPLIQSFFVSVFSSHAKIRLFFFRKRVWHRLRHRAFYDFTKFCKLDVIAEHKVYDMIRQGKCLGCVRVNFILKRNSLRPISNLSFQEKGKASINTQLASLLHVLKYEKDTNKQYFGVTSMGKFDFHRNFQKYVMRVRTNKLKKMYFITADVEKCFDSVQPSLLLKISHNLIRSDLYVVYKYKRHISGQRKGFRYFESVHDLKHIQQRFGNVELIGQRSVTKKSLVKNLEALLLGNVIKMGKNYFIQKKGISQGSKVSSILCSAYLSHLESEIGITKGLDDLLVRAEDEYLFVSTMKSSAESFLRHLIVCMPKFDCRVNAKKCVASFDCDLGPDFEKIQSSSMIKFYGLSFNSTDLCVSSDYSGYVKLRASHVVTCKRTKNMGKALRKCVFESLYPKCDSILFDCNINTEIVLKRNALQIFCMTAVKFHFLVLCLPQQNRIDKNPTFFLNIIQSLPSLLHQHINLLLSRAIPSKNGKVTSPLSIETVYGLCFNAFLFKLQKNKSIYGKIIDELKAESQLYPTVPKTFVIAAFNAIYLR